MRIDRSGYVYQDVWKSWKPWKSLEFSKNLPRILKYLFPIFISYMLTVDLIYSCITNTFVFKKNFCYNFVKMAFLSYVISLLTAMYYAICCYRIIAS